MSSLCSIQRYSLSTPRSGGISHISVPVQVVPASTVDIYVQISECRNEFQGHTVLALDCEGVDLCRHGEITIIQLSTPNKCYLFDMVGQARSSALVQFLKSILENPSITKIIHDVKMDADALYHTLGIQLQGIHDTQAWDKVLRGSELNLNKTLIAYGCRANAERDHSVYDRNHRFWATRPLTTIMIEWASGDVRSLFDLYERQLARATPTVAATCRTASEVKAMHLTRMITQWSSISPCNIGWFIGPGGSNLRAMEQRVPGSFFQFRGAKGSGKVIVYAVDQNTMASALRQVANYQ